MEYPNTTFLIYSIVYMDQGNSDRSYVIYELCKITDNNDITIKILIIVK